MVKKDNILRKNKDFDLVFKKGTSSYGQFLGVKILQNNLPYNRFGILISAKVSKLAVKRNKFKRQIRFILKTEQEKFTKNYDYIIIVSPKIREKKYSELEEELKKCFNKLKLYLK